MDGGSEVWKRLQTFQGTSAWKEFRWDYMDDVNTVLRAIEVAEEEAIIHVYDIHEESYNFPKDLSGKNVILFNGIFYKTLPFIRREDSFDGAFFIGFHSGPGEKGFSQYLFKPGFDYVKVNGETWGELDFFVQLISILKIPLLFVSGTEEVVSKAKEKYKVPFTLSIDKDPELYRGNVSSRRFTQSIRDNYGKVISEAINGKGVLTEPLHKGNIEIKLKSGRKIWHLDNFEVSIDKKERTIFYKFNTPEEILKIIFCHSYFTSNFSCKTLPLSIFLKNTKRKLKNKGIIKGL